MTPTFKSPEVTYNVMKFPSGEVQVTLQHLDIDADYSVSLTGSILSSDQLMELLQLVDTLRNEGIENIYLHMPYCAYSRQDRRCKYGEALSSKVFATLINSCKFTKVYTYDNHSDVITALLDNCVNTPVHMILHNCMSFRVHPYDFFVSPDAGANKKVLECSKIFSKPMIRADKVRDLSTGRITHTEVFATPEQLDNKTVLIVDDICQGGRTFIELAKALKEISPTVKIHLYVTHGFFSHGIQPLINAGIDKLITTNSIVDLPDTKLQILDLEEV